MKLNLRKASALQDRMRREISAQEALVSGKLTDPFWKITDEHVARERAQQIKTLDTLERLEEILEKLREQVGRINAKSGISNLLTENARITGQIRRLTGLAKSDPAPSSSELERQLESKRAQRESSHYFGDDHISVGVFGAPDIERMSSSLTRLRRRQTEIADSLILKNIENEATIADSDWSWLELQGIV